MRCVPKFAISVCDGFWREKSSVYYVESREYIVLYTFSLDVYLEQKSALMDGLCWEKILQEYGSFPI